MDQLGSSPFATLEFDKDGRLIGSGQEAFSALIASGIGEVVVMSHGWKNDRDDALRLYETLWHNTCQNLPPAKLAAIGVVGVIWPAKQFPTDFDAQDLVPPGGDGGAMAADTTIARRDLEQEDFDSQLKALASFFPKGEAAATIEAAREVGDGITTIGAAHLVIVGSDLVRLHREARADTELGGDARPLLEAKSDADRAVLIAALAPPPRLALSADVGSAQGLSEQVEGLFEGPRAAAARFLNQLTYFEMKKRAGIVGRNLAENVLAQVVLQKPLRLHLVGHSFGARLVTAATSVLAPPVRMELFSVTLLQGAFSHNALARNLAAGVAGAFKDAVGKPKGPFVITHTHNDQACTLAYALASRLSRDIATAIGDANDVFGAMGANGPQNLEPGAAAADDTGQAFRFVKARINPVLADAFIDAHNNVANQTCGRLLAGSILA